MIGFAETQRGFYPDYCRTMCTDRLSIMQAQHWVAGLTHVPAAVILIAE